MTNDMDRVAKIVAEIIGTADGGCSSCVRDLCDRLSKSDIGYNFAIRVDKRGNKVSANMYQIAVDATAKDKGETNDA
jgi:hypothetical protein